MSDILQQLKKAVLEGEDDQALSLVRKAIEQEIQPVTLVNQSIMPGIQQAGELWKKNMYFQSDVIMSAEAFRVTMQVVEPLLAVGEAGNAKKVAIGTVAGDMHNLGKTIVIAMLRGAGFSVTDLGEDVPASTFIDTVKDLKPDILGLGCYMTTTMLEMKEVIRSLNDNGLRDHVKVMIGGVPTSQEFADEIGADGWGKDALDSIDKAKQLTGVS
jgi:corrinoid protein of di/trimethylamine methyltransferase